MEHCHFLVTKDGTAWFVDEISQQNQRGMEFARYILQRLRIRQLLPRTEPVPKHRKYRQFLKITNKIPKVPKIYQQVPIKSNFYRLFTCESVFLLPSVLVAIDTFDALLLFLIKILCFLLLFIKYQSIILVFLYWFAPRLLLNVRRCLFRATWKWEAKRDRNLLFSRSTSFSLSWKVPSFSHSRQKEMELFKTKRKWWNEWKWERDQKNTQRRKQNLKTTEKRNQLTDNHLQHRPATIMVQSENNFFLY